MRAAQRRGAAQLAGSSEDCLYLNVTKPRGRATPKPVMVWIHGGGNFQGAGSKYDPRRMAQRGDVVVVTINYRLGAFGLLSHPGLDGSGTFGLRDQQAALRWVRSNAATSGRPSRPCAGRHTRGQGAGLYDADLPAHAPDHREAAGVRHHVRHRDRNANSAARSGVGVAFRRVPVLSGNTRDEARLSTMLVEFLSGPITRERYEKEVREAFGADAAEIERRYPAGDSPGATALALAAMDTDRVFACPQLETSSLLSAYAYEFSDRTAPTFVPFLTGMPPGASHASELAYLFTLLDGAPYGSDLKHVELTAEQRRLGDAMIDAWTRFARTGKPGWPKSPYTQSFGERVEPIDARRVHQCDLWRQTPSAAVR